MKTEEQIETAAKLREAITHTKARLEKLNASLSVRTLDVMNSRLVADSPGSDLFVAIAKPVDGKKTIGFIYAPLATSGELLTFGPGEDHYLTSLKAEYDALPVGTALTNLRFVSKREFNRLLIPILEQILFDTEAALCEIERVTE